MAARIAGLVVDVIVRVLVFLATKERSDLHAIRKDKG